MAWQLIYTSAPRLLEAGRTGFGTVARHRAVSGMLASAVERFSQFARLPGHDPRRVVHTCRILTVGSSTYHVLSCLQDAGSDYTGRTNHIAHHLIAEPREVRALAAAGITPADVLLGMAWRTSWSEGPRFLDSAEEIDLASFASRPSHAWAGITGNPASASLLWSREALKGCYLITPPGAPVLDLFRESLLATPGQAWQTRFTTCLEPNDDLSDFRWVAMASTSPMRSQVENSARLVLDLTHPASLPPLPEPDEPSATEAPAAPQVPALPKPQLQAVPSASMQLPSAGSAPISTMGGWSPDTRQKSPKKARSYIAISLVLAVLLIGGVSGGLIWQFNKQQKQTQDRNAYESAVEKLWKDNHLLLEDTKKFLIGQTTLEDGRKLLKSHESFFGRVKQVLHQPEKSTDLALPDNNQDDLGELKTRLDEWAALHAAPWEKLRTEKAAGTIVSIGGAFSKWDQSRKTLWKKLTDYIDLNDPPTPSSALLEPLKTLAKEVLTRSEPTRENYQTWEDLFASLDRLKSPMTTEAQWLKLCKQLDEPPSPAAVETALKDPTLPAWLVAKAKSVKEKQDKAGTSQMADKGKPDKPDQSNETQKPKVVFEDADAFPGKHQIHVLLLKPGEDPVGKVSGLNVAKDMQLYVGGALDSHPIPDNKAEPKSSELKPWRVVPLDNPNGTTFGPNLSDTITLSHDGNLTAMAEVHRSAASGLRIVGRSKDGISVLFDLRILPAKATAQPLLQYAVSTTLAHSPEQLESAELGQLIARLRFINVKTQYKLRPPGNIGELWDVSPQGEKCTLSVPQIAATTDNLAIASQKQLIQAIKDGIKSQESLKSNLKSSLSDYEAKLKQYDTAIAVKQDELAAAERKLAELEKPKELPKPKAPVAGEYTLIALTDSSVVLDICKVQILPPSKSSTPKPSNP